LFRINPIFDEEAIKKEANIHKKREAKYLPNP